MSVVLSEHLPLLASAPDGIQKLRGLILELAVRGKLVPQDPDDEPELTTLGGVGRWAVGSGFPTAEQGTIGAEILFAKVSDMNLPDNGRFIVTTNNTISRETAARLRVNVHPAGTVVFPKIGGAIATNKRRILVRDTAIDNNCLGLTPKPGVLSDWLFVLLSAIDFTEYQAGTSVPALAQGVLAEIPVRLPSVAEQNQIVAKVDELMALCDRLETEQADAASAHARLVETLLGTLTQSTDAADLVANWQRFAEHFDTLFTTEASIDALKQTVLRLAVMGKLVPQDPKDEPAGELLKRVAQERARLEREGVCKKSKPIPAVSHDSEYLLPNTWQWSALDPLVGVMDSGWSPACIETPSPDDSVWGVLKTTAVQTFQYLEFENKELPSHLAPRPECEVASGDILITRAGPKNRVAISCLVETTRPKLMISDKIIRFHLVEGGMYDKFVALCLNAGTTAAYLESAKSGMAASQMNITQEKLRMAPIPICSTAEQHRIVAKVDELMVLCDRLKADLVTSRHRQATLADTLIESALEAA